jgi:hypothetical protein
VQRTSFFVFYLDSKVLQIMQTSEHALTSVSRSRSGLLNPYLKVDRNKGDDFAISQNYEQNIFNIRMPKVYNIRV